MFVVVIILSDVMFTSCYFKQVLSLLTFALILSIKVGDVDFYPNSGMAPQPGCKGEPIGLDCSHQRANVRQLL